MSGGADGKQAISSGFVGLTSWAVLSLQERSGGPIKIAGDVGSFVGGGWVEQGLTDFSASCFLQCHSRSAKSTREKSKTWPPSIARTFRLGRVGATCLRLERGGQCRRTLHGTIYSIYLHMISFGSCILLGCCLLFTAFCCVVCFPFLYFNSPPLPS